MEAGETKQQNIEMRCSKEMSDREKTEILSNRDVKSRGEVENGTSL